MRILILTAVALFFFSKPLFAAPDLDLEHRYLEVYLEINDAEHIEKKADLPAALKDFKECYEKLKSIRADSPYWETALVVHRMYDCRAKIVELQLKLSVGNGSVPADETLAQIRANYPGPVQTGARHSYAWKSGIAIGLFWIGKDGEKRSAWDDDWMKSNGGVDSPDDRNGFSAAAHVDKLNPFYVALPFNDLAHAEAAEKWVPAAWHRQLQEGKPVSACKDRWVQVTNAEGRSCFAQWEDAGPSGDDDPEYVFGKSIPKVEDKPAMSVSPAVAQYLELNDDITKRVAWRFIDEADVPPGQWLKYQEQGLIYAAMNE